MEPGYWILDTEYWILDTGYWILDTGYWTGLYWILDTKEKEQDIKLIHFFILFNILILLFVRIY